MNRDAIIDKKPSLPSGQMGGPYPELQVPNRIRVRRSPIRRTRLYGT